MDLASDDSRGWALAPHLVVVSASPWAIEWLSPDTGTTCRLDSNGDYVVLRRQADRMVPVVAGQITSEDAERIWADPGSVRARRAAAHSIVAVDQATAQQPPG